MAQLYEHLNLFVNRIGQCSKCMRQSFVAALFAGAVYAVGAMLFPESGITMMAGVVALALSNVWILHVVVFAARTLATSRHKAARSDHAAGSHDRRRALAFIARAAGIGVAASMPLFLASQALAFCGQCSKDEHCGVGYVCRNTAPVNSGTVCNECVSG